MGFLFNVIITVLIIYLLVTVNSLKSQLSPGEPKSATAIPNKEITEEEPVEKDTVEEKPAESSAGPDPVEQFLKWFARDWPLKVGAVFVLVGIGWFLTYAFANNLIGPLGRLIIGLVAGAAVMVLGNIRIKKNIYQGEILATLGAGVLLATVFASEHMYANLVRMLYPQWVSLVLVTFVIFVLTFTSYVNKTMRLAVLAFLVGAIAPFIIGAPKADVVLIFGYLLALTLGLIWLVRRTGWRILIIMPLITVIIYTLIYRLIFNLTPDQRLWMEFFCVTFTCVFYFSSLAAFAYEKSRDQKDLLVGGLFSLYCLIWVTSYVSSINQSIVFAMFALVFMTGAFILNKMKSVDDAVYLYFIVSTVFLVIATFLQIKDPGLLPVVLTAEAVLLMVFSDRIYSARAAFIVSILFIPSVLLSLGLFTAYSGLQSGYYASYSPYLGLSNSSAYPASHTFDIQIIFINILLCVAGLYGYLYQKHTEIVKMGKLLCVTAAVYSLYYLWTAIPYYLQQANGLLDGKIIVLIVFAVIGLGLYFYGIRAVKVWTKRFGLILACFVIIRLMLFEIWSMTIPAKIITFIVVGVIFMLSVFIQVSMHEKKIL